MAQCKAKTKTGERCQSFALKGQAFCYRHSEAIPQEEKQAASAKGGSTNRLIKTPLDIEVKFESPEDVLLLLAEITTTLLRGQISPAIANSVGYLSNICLRALESHSLEERVSKLEEMVGTQGNLSNPVGGLKLR